MTDIGDLLELWISLGNLRGFAEAALTEEPSDISEGVDKALGDAVRIMKKLVEDKWREKEND